MFLWKVLLFAWLRHHNSGVFELVMFGMSVSARLDQAVPLCASMVNLFAQATPLLMFFYERVYKELMLADNSNSPPLHHHPAPTRSRPRHDVLLPTIFSRMSNMP